MASSRPWRSGSTLSSSLHRTGVSWNSPRPIEVFFSEGSTPPGRGAPGCDGACRCAQARLVALVAVRLLPAAAASRESGVGRPLYALHGKLQPIWINSREPFCGCSSSPMCLRLVLFRVASSNSRRLSVTSATSFAEVFVFTTPVVTHGSVYCTTASSTLAGAIVPQSGSPRRSRRCAALASCCKSSNCCVQAAWLGAA